MIGASTVICGLRPVSIAGQPGIAGLRRQNRIFQHGLIEFEADFANMTRLFVAQQIARAANVEVVAGKLEPRAQRIEIAQHLQPLLRHFGQRRVGGVVR